jgi:hypothetical protein
VVKVENLKPTQATTEKNVIESPTLEVELGDPPVVEAKQVTKPIQINEKVKPQSSLPSEIGEIQDEVVKEQKPIDIVEAVEPKMEQSNNAIAITLPMREPSNFQQLKVTPTFQSDPSTQTNSVGSTSVMTIAVLNGIYLWVQSTIKKKTIQAN